MLATYEKDFHCNDRLLYLNGVSADSNYVKDNHTLLFDEAVLDFTSTLEEDREAKFPSAPSGLASSGSNSLNVSAATSSHSHMRLKTIEIPPFSGDYTKWPVFRDMFVSLVHTNQEYSRIEKFWYLKSVLADEALNTIGSIVMLDEHYDDAWKVLHAQYENPREIFRMQMTQFYAFSRVEKEEPRALRLLLNSLRDCRQNLKSFKLESEHFDPILIFFAIQKLPNYTKGLWETSLGKSKELPTFNNFAEFIDTRIKALDAMFANAAPKTTPNVKKTFYTQQEESHKSSSKKKGKNKSSKSFPKCMFCPESHPTKDCSNFLALSIPYRIEAITDKKMCSNCLSPAHLVQNCTHPKTCWCGARHHALLHSNLSSNAESFTHASTSSKDNTGNSLNINVARVAERRVLLATALVQVENSQGNLVELRALVDKGSEATLITERAANLLGIRRRKSHTEITAIGDVQVGSSSSFMEITIKSKNSDYNSEVPAFIVKKLTNSMPSEIVHCHNWPHIKDIVLADPLFATPSKIDLVLGADVYSDILCDGLRKQQGLPTAQNTELGYILFGSIEPASHPPKSIRTHVTKIEIDKLIRRFWEIETIEEMRDPSADDLWCEQFFSDTLSIQEGRYQVRLPLKTHTDPRKTLGQSRQIAVNSLLQLERKFARNPEFATNYRKQFHEYLDAGHMVLAETPERDFCSHENGKIIAKCAYLPHHAIIKETSSTTKMRIVFDASRSTANGNSLNDILHTGPKLHNDLPSVIINWRGHKVPFTTDLKQMFLQILVHPNDAQYQRVVWRDSPNEPPQDFYLKTVTFGTSSAPYLANRVIKQIATDFKAKYPLIYIFLTEAIYVDDLFGGAESIELALDLQSQLIKAFEERGFHARKWTSSVERVLAAVPAEDRELKLPLHLNADESVKTLGIYWLPQEDCFKFLLNFDPLEFLNANKPVTKRVISSTVGRLFDPCGIISPVIMLAKLFLRESWLLNLDWDDLVPPEFVQKWTEFARSLLFLPQLRIPRWLGTTSQSDHFEFHCFCDASQNGYAAAIYFRSRDQTGSFQTHLITSKSKPAPTKATTIPRLELLGAELLAELVKKVQKNWRVTANFETYAWCDSEIVLYWLHGDTNRLEIFVANRVTRILDVIPITQWSHVPSEMNSADLASRGLLPMELQKNDLWWNGPEFLRQAKENWPKVPFHPRDFGNEGVKKAVIKINTIVKNAFFTELLERFSDYDKLLRVTAYMQKFLKGITRKIVNKRISVSDLKEARKLWVQVIQKQEFALEIKALGDGENLPTKSRLLSLNPFLDADNILRVGGRLKQSLLNYNQKHPIILPQKCQFTTLLIQRTHEMSLHGGTQLVLTLLRHEFWIINARNSIRFEILKCITCFRCRAQSGEQQMGNLPWNRITPSLPFETTGLDFTGAINVKASNLRNAKIQKGYISVFRCFTTRAIHLELVSDMTVPTFRAALKRFLGRRTACHDIHSDNGLTFVGMNNLLKAQAKIWKKEVEEIIVPDLANRGIDWTFIPVASPWFGGIWESAVKSAKFHIKRVCGDKAKTFEEWSTLLVEIEGILNSRPLCPLTADPDDLEAITPNHFLNGDIAHPLTEAETDRSFRGFPSRLLELNDMKRVFWKQWSSDYLQQLQSRPKWLQTKPNFKVNDLVIIKEDNIPSFNWLLGRIVEVHPGKDGLVRVATVKTKSRVYAVPIRRLCLLPVEHAE